MRLRGFLGAAGQIRTADLIPVKEICDDEEFTVSQCTMEDGIPEAIRPERLNELAKYIHLNRDFLKLEQQAHWFHKLKDWVEENAQWDVSSDFINFYEASVV